MDKLTKEGVTTWVQCCNWLLIGEGKNNEGFPQDTYLTPAGSVVFAIFDLDGNLRHFAMPMPPMAMPPMPQGRPSFDLRGGSSWPPGR